MLVAVAFTDRHNIFLETRSRSIPPFQILLDRLTTRVEGPLPGHEAHRRMAPRHSVRENVLSIEGRECREAGVLALLLARNASPAIVLTVRRTDLPDHGGQISFPGGQREDAEPLSVTALRETEEEIGLPRTEVTMIGKLTPLYIPPSNFCVHPFLGAASNPPPLSPTDEEVDQILPVSLEVLLDPKTRIVEPWDLHGEQVDVPYYEADEHKIWGATAMILSEVLALVREAVDTGSDP